MDVGTDEALQEAFSEIGEARVRERFYLKQLDELQQRVELLTQQIEHMELPDQADNA